MKNERDFRRIFILFRKINNFMVPLLSFGPQSFIGPNFILNVRIALPWGPSFNSYQCLHITKEMW